MNGLQIQVDTDAPEVTDVIHELLQFELLPSAILSLLRVHLETLKETWERFASVLFIPKRY